MTGTHRGPTFISTALGAALIGLMFNPHVVAAQDGCTWDTCALRVRHRAFATEEVVQGSSGTRVAKISLLGFAPDLPLLSTRSDSAAMLYRQFRSGNNSGAWMQILGATGLIAGLIVETSGHEGTAIGLGLAASIPAIWGTFRRIRARDRLNRSIWWYNRSLQGPRPPGR